MNSSVCPNCKSPIPPDAPGGICPGCAMLAAAGPTMVPGPGAATPGIEEVAAAFPELEVLEMIGQGGMGIVYKARQPKLDRLVALKILPPVLAAQPGFAERFTREARALARLSHPHIVTVYDFGESGGFFHLLMEYVDGVNLRAAMRAGVTPGQALALVPHICEALQFAHDHGVLHRDIKPENILLDTRGVPKLADFGIAKLAGEPTVGGLTLSGAQLGTAAYMAPEQVEKPATVDHRADIYSLGVVLYEMLTGELPLGRFAAPSEKSHCTRGVDDVVLRALEKERERRQQSAKEMQTQVEHATVGGAAANPATDDDESGGPWSRILLSLTSLSAVGIPIAGMLRWKMPSPIHMVAAVILFGTLYGLVSGYERSRPARAPRQRMSAATAALIATIFTVLAIALPTLVVELTKGNVTGSSLGFAPWLGANCALIAFVFGIIAYRRRAITAAVPVKLALNPWPRRIFWLIVVLVVGPLLLFIAGMVVPYLAMRRPPTRGAATVSVSYEKDPIRPQGQVVTISANAAPGTVVDYSFRIRDAQGERELPAHSALTAWNQSPMPNSRADGMMNTSARWEIIPSGANSVVFSVRKDIKLVGPAGVGTVGSLSGVGVENVGTMPQLTWLPHPDQKAVTWQGLPVKVPFMIGNHPAGPGTTGAELFILATARAMKPGEEAPEFTVNGGSDRAERLSNPAFNGTGYKRLVPGEGYRKLPSREETLQDEAIASAERALADANKLYEAGIIGPREVADLQLALEIAQARGDTVKAAQAKVRHATGLLEMLSKQVEIGIATPQALDAAKAKLNEAQQELERAKKAPKLER